MDGSQPSTSRRRVLSLFRPGKLEEIAGAAASVSADLLLFDHDLTASQQRNIEREALEVAQEILHAIELQVVKIGQ